MGNYGMYDGINKKYISKKGKNWYEKQKMSNSHRLNDDTFFSFRFDKTQNLEEDERTNNRPVGLVPFAFIPKEDRTGYTKEYFGIETLEVLRNSLDIMVNSIPYCVYDTISTFNIQTTTYTDEMGIVRPNIVNDYYNAVVTRDNLTSGYLSNTILAFCFAYYLPENILFSDNVFGNIIHTISTFPSFCNRALLIRTDMNNNRILFMVSNLTENENDLEKYKNMYEMGIAKKYKGPDIELSKRGNYHFSRLETSIINNYNKDMNKNIFISKM